MIPVYNIYIVKTILCKHKLHILEILACRTKGRLKNGSASLCHYQRNEFYIFEFVAACGPRQTHFHTEAQTDSRDWRNPLRQNLTVLPAPPKGGSFICADRKMAKSSPFGGAGIEQSEMTERVSHPGAGTALLTPGQASKIDFPVAEPFQIVFPSKMEYNGAMNILPRLRLRYGRNLI